MMPGIIHFGILFNTFLSLKCQKAQKNGDFGPKNGHFGFENGHRSFQKYFHLIRSEKLYYGAWNHPFWPLSSMVTRLIPHCALPFPPPFVIMISTDVSDSMILSLFHTMPTVYNILTLSLC